MEKENILIVIDAQNDFIDGALSNDVAQERVSNIISLIKSKKWDFVILTRDTHENNYLETQEGRKLPIEHCIKGSHGWQIHKDIMKTVIEQDIPYNIINKHTFGYEYIGNSVYEICNEFSELTITMCGFCTDICVISNALILKSYFIENTEINVIENACAGVTPESHDAAIMVMKNCQINIK